MPYSVISPLAEIGDNTRIYDFVNIYGKCRIGSECVVGAFVEIQPGVSIGNKTKISSHTFICDGVSIADEVFVGHGVVFTNDKLPRAVFPGGEVVTHATTEIIPTYVERRASIGSGCSIVCGITIGEGALVGAGSVVAHDVPPYAVVAGNPAKILRYRDKQELWAQPRLVDGE